jgi:UTP--glucose-1-phosphate uridylyltransferase
MEFKELTKRDAQISLAHELDKLRKTSNLPAFQADLVDKEFDGFQKLFAKFILADASSAIQWEQIGKLPAGSLIPYGALADPEASSVKAMLDELVVVKLNGGLGT